MDKEIIKILVRELAILLAWRDQVQNLPDTKKSWEYESELFEKIDRA